MLAAPWTSLELETEEQKSAAQEQLDSARKRLASANLDIEIAKESLVETLNTLKSGSPFHL